MHFLSRAAGGALLALSFSQAAVAAEPEPPKLVVVILVDQMRYDYLERFRSHFVEGGFKWLLDHGAVMTEARYDYCPTVTGPGHASFLSGSPPAVHGIIGNDWFDKRSGKMINCVSDESVTPVGTTNAGCKRSPKNFIGDNFSDEMRLRYRSKVIGISMKDRGAILPAGKRPAGAYWFDGLTGNFVTSTYYAKALPAWLTEFNDAGRSKAILGQKWERLLAENEYEWPDAAPGEGFLAGEKKVTFPHEVSLYGKLVVEPLSTLTLPADDTTGDVKKAGPAEAAPPKPAPSKPSKPAPPPKPVYDNIEPTPFGNHLVEELAEAAVTGEQLGAGSGTDVLTISFSSIDGAGHIFGPYSQEVEDMVLRLDRDLATLFAFLDKKVGLAHVCVALTADHGVAPLPEWAVQQGLAGERVDEIPLMADLLGKLYGKFGPGSYFQTRRFIQGNLYFNHAYLAERKLPEADVASFIRDWALANGKFEAAFTREQLLAHEVVTPIGMRVMNGFNAERSGDVVLVYKPYVMTYGKTGTTHGSPYDYDTHVPVIFCGAPFRPGRYADPFKITDLAPTLCAALRVQTPAGAIGTACARILENP